MIVRELRSVDAGELATLEAFQLEAPVKLASICRAFGISVKSSTLPVGISGEIRPDRERAGSYVIKVNRHDSSRRQRFTIAHEVSHFLLHRDQIGSGIEDDALYRSSLSDRREAEANRLASAILMPENLIKEWVSQARLLKVDDVAAYLADRFDVSESAMRIRLGLA